MQVRYIGEREFGVTNIKGEIVYLKNGDTVETSEVEGRGYIMGYPKEFEKVEMSDKEQIILVNGLVREVNSLKAEVQAIKNLIVKHGLNVEAEKINEKINDLTPPVDADLGEVQDSDESEQLPVDAQDQTPVDQTEDTIEVLREKFTAKFNSVVPANKKNDMQWIKAKLAG